jgi:hypothetical protein
MFNRHYKKFGEGVLPIQSRHTYSITLKWTLSYELIKKTILGKHLTNCWGPLCCGRNLFCTLLGPLITD